MTIKYTKLENATSKLGIGYAYDSNKNMVSIANRGEGRVFSCLFCGGRLFPTDGPINIPHFRHFKDDSCWNSYESLMHKFAKFILENNKEITLPSLIDNSVSTTVFTYTNVTLEKKYNNMVPDIRLEGLGEDLFIEINVTHKVDDEKKDKIYNSCCNFLEINLSSFYKHVHRLDFYDELADLILTTVNNTNKKWIVNKQKIIALKTLNILRKSKKIKYSISDANIFFELDFEIANLIEIKNDDYFVIELLGIIDRDFEAIKLKFLTNYKFYSDDSWERFVRLFSIQSNDCERVLVFNYSDAMDFDSDYYLHELLLNPKISAPAIAPFFAEYKKTLHEMWKEKKKAFIAFNTEGFFAVLVESCPEKSFSDHHGEYIKFLICEDPNIYLDKNKLSSFFSKKPLFRIRNKIYDFNKWSWVFINDYNVHSDQ